MTMARSALAVSACVLLAACGDGVINFGGDFSKSEITDNIVVRGSLRNVFDPNSTRPIVVFVYTNVDKDAKLPYVAGQYDSFGTTRIAAGSDSSKFSISDLRRGALTVVFLFDQPEGNTPGPDGSIDCVDVTVDRAAHCDAPTATTTTTDGAPIASASVLVNAVATLVKAGELKDVRGGSTVTIDDIDVNFNNPVPPDGAPTIAEAETDRNITVEIERSSGNENDDG